MSADIRDTIHERALLVRAALAKRDREWEECLKLIDDRPPLTPDPEWFREWGVRVFEKEPVALVRETTDANVAELRDILVNAVLDMPIEGWPKAEIVCLINKVLDEYPPQE